MPILSSDRPTEGDENAVDAQPTFTPPRDDLSEFYATFSGAGYKFAISRVKPKSAFIKGQLRTVAGHLETIEEPPSPDYISEVWGGGTFEIKVRGPRKDGKGTCYVASRTIDIVGDPKIKAEKLVEIEAATDPIAAVDPSLMQRMLDEQAAEKKRLEERLERERERSERIAAERVSGPDPAMWQSTVGVIQSTADNMVVTLREQLARRDAELTELRREIHARPGDAEMIKLIERRAQDDAARMVETHRRELEAERREHEQSMGMIERVHRSELENIKALHQQQIESMRTNHDQQITFMRTTYEQQIDRLASDLEQTRSERGRTRRRDDDEEAPDMFHAIKEELKPHIGPTLARLVDNLSRVQAPVGPTRPMVRMPVPPVQIVQTPMGPMVVPAVAAPPIPGPQARAVASSVARTPAPSKPTASPIEGITRFLATPVKQQASAESAGVLRQSIDFFETAIRNGTKPADVARSALSMFPKTQLETIANADVRAVLAEIEREVGPDRVISSPAGREFLKGMQQAIREMLKTKTA